MECLCGCGVIVYSNCILVLTHSGKMFVGFLVEGVCTTPYERRWWNSLWKMFVGNRRHQHCILAKKWDEIYIYKVGSTKVVAPMCL